MNNKKQEGTATRKGKGPQKNYLSERVEETKENGALVRTKSGRLENCFLEEATFPIMEKGQASVENEVIPLLPYLPGRDNEEFHEEIMMHLRFGFLHHYMERGFKSRVDA
jgi:hypothetical protein